MISSFAPLFTSRWGLAGLGLALAAGLVAIGWFDYSSTQREFDALVRAQAASVRGTVSAAARANRAAGEEAQKELANRLLDNARFLAEMDASDRLAPEFLQEVAVRNHLFRLTVLAPDGTRERYVAAPGGGPGRGQGGPGWFAGPGLGSGPGTAPMIDRLIKNGEREVVTDLHSGWRGGVARLAAGVRRQNGGAILISVDATDVANLQRQSSLDRLLGDIVQSTEDVAYVIFEQDDVRRAQGDLPPASAPDVHAAGAGTTPGSPEGAGASVRVERELEVRGRPVLEITGPIDLGDGQEAHLHLGMRLDRLRHAERRTMSRLVVSLGAAVALGVLAIGLVWLHRQYGTLSVAHARAQEALQRRDRLAAMGELASTVAHEIRNPLNAIAMSAQRLQRECFARAATDDEEGPSPDADEAIGLVNVIKGEAQRINAKVQQFLDYARPPALVARPTRLREWLSGIAHAVQPLASARGVALLLDDAPDEDVSLDPELMRQAVDNLVRNAIDATPAGGAVTLAAARAGRELTIEVRDTGAGIDPEHLPKIFDLYFTTKADGTGVGLAVTQQIVAGHGGVIEVDSSPGRGSTMRIRIPLVLAEAVHA